MSTERVSRGAGFALLAQLVSAFSTAGLTIFLARALSGDQYGYFTFGISVITLVSLFADFGIASSTGRFIAERRDERREAAEVFRTGLRLKVAAAALAAVALIALAGPICDVFGAPEAVWVLRALAFALAGQTVFLMVLGAFIALGVIRWNVLITTVESAVEALATVVLVLLGAAAVGAGAGRALGYGVGLAAGLLVVSRVIGALRRVPSGPAEPAEPVKRRYPPVSSRMILTYAGPLVLVDAAFRVFSSVDVLLISLIVGAGVPVAAYGLAMQLTLFLQYPGAALASAVAPRLASVGDDAGGVELFEQSVRYLVVLQGVLTAPLVIWSEPIVDLLFGSKYVDTPEVLVALTPYVFLLGIAQITTLGVNYIGEARKRVPVAVVMLVVNITTALVLLPRVGIVGAAIGTSAAYAIWVPGHLLILRRRTGFDLRKLLVTAARVLLAGAAMVGALALIGTGDVGLASLLLGAVVGPAVYVAALLALREVTGNDVRALRSALARRAG